MIIMFIDLVRTILDGKAAAFERGLDPYERQVNDILSTRGFVWALQLVRRLHRGGLIVAAPPCSSWIWMNSGTSGRSRVLTLGGRVFVCMYVWFQDWVCWKDGPHRSHLVLP